MRDLLGDVPWTEVRDCVVALGTLGPLGVSLMVVKRQGEELRDQASERRSQAEFARSAQARQVRLDPPEKTGSDAF